MAINWKWPGWTWLEHLGENTSWTFFAALTGAILASGADRLTAIHWGEALDVAAYAALVGALASLGKLRIRNGTDSLNPHVIAAPRKDPS